MKKIGITGMIGSGKTTVSILLRRKGYRVFDCDGYTHMLYRKTDPCFQKLVDAFGETILDQFGEIDRKALAALVFQDEAKRLQLNRIVHPAVIEGMNRFFANHPEEELLFAEVPLLFEAKMESCFDQIIVVAAPREVSVRRMMEDRGYSEEEANARYDAAVRQEEQTSKATIVLRNEGTLHDLNDRVIDLLAALENENAA